MARPNEGDSYDVSVYGSSSEMSLVPGSFVMNSEYRPSQQVEEQVAVMWDRRTPRAVGSVSEMMATEILGNAQIRMGGSNWALACDKLGNVEEISGRWKPTPGIYCDDLIATAETNHGKLVFLTEVKGTTRKGGLSRSMEAKMFYQLARTCVTLKKMMPSGPYFPIAGAITVAIIHFQRKIVMNVLNEAAISGYFPDGWLPPTVSY